MCLGVVGIELQGVSIELGSTARISLLQEFVGRAADPSGDILLQPAILSPLELLDLFSGAFVLLQAPEHGGELVSDFFGVGVELLGFLQSGFRFLEFARARQNEAKIVDSVVVIGLVPDGLTQLDLRLTVAPHAA